MRQTGSRLQVMKETAKKTTGGLVKTDLIYNKYGKIVSKNKSNMSKKIWMNRGGVIRKF